MMKAFTLLEAMVSIAIFVLLMSAVASLWIVCYKATERVARGGYSDELPNLVVKRLKEAVESSIFHKQPKGLYAWRGRDDFGAGEEGDSISFVTSLPPDVAESSAESAPLERIMIIVRRSSNGVSQLVLLAAPFTMNEEDWQRETVLLEDISAFRVRYWDGNNKNWREGWTEEEYAPTSVQIGILMKGDQPGSSEWKYHCTVSIDESLDPETLIKKEQPPLQPEQPPQPQPPVGGP